MVYNCIYYQNFHLLMNSISTWIEFRERVTRTNNPYIACLHLLFRYFYTCYLFLHCNIPRLLTQDFDPSEISRCETCYKSTGSPYFSRSLCVILNQCLPLLCINFFRRDYLTSKNIGL